MKMNECYGKKFILNGVLQSSDMFDNSLVYEGDSIYEVLRMAKGHPVFFDDHMDRLLSSVRLRKKNLLAEPRVIRRDVINLAKCERRKDVNLKIVFNYNRESHNYLIYFIEPIYPSEEQYRKGVKGILFHAERKDPESKVINHKLRSEIYHKLILLGGYEALLVNEENCITEGSRTNIFFYRNGELTTAPDEKVLNGITRKHILEICIEKNIRVEFKCVPVDSLSGFEAVFMTGTSPVVLPFSNIDDVNFRVQIPLIKTLRVLCLERAEESTRQFLENY